MIRTIPISRRVLTILVATMYLATSSTALLHALSHVPTPIERQCTASQRALSQAEPTSDQPTGNRAGVTARAVVDARSGHPSGVAADDAVSAGLGRGTPECFFCHHGPAVALAIAPPAMPTPSLLPATITTVVAAQAHSALRTPLPSLRAPPVLS